MFRIKPTESKDARSANSLTRTLSTAHMVLECWFSLSGRRRCHGKSDCYPLGVREVCSWRKAGRGQILRDLSGISYIQGAHTERVYRRTHRSSCQAQTVQNTGHSVSHFCSFLSFHENSAEHVIGMYFLGTMDVSALPSLVFIHS